MSGINTLFRFFKRRIGKPRRTSITLTESLGMTDTLTQSVDFVADLTETLNAADTPVIDSTFLTTLQDILKLLDTNNLTEPVFIQVASLFDSVKFDYGVPLPQVLNLTDILTTISSEELVLMEAMTLMDSVVHKMIFTLLQSLSTSDSNIFKTDFSITQDLILSDVLALVLTVFAAERIDFVSTVKDRLSFDSKVREDLDFVSTARDQISFDSKVKES